MKRNTIPWVLVILLMALIFYLSHQPASTSNGLSKKTTEVIVKVVQKVNPNIDINKRRFNHLLRKNAHFFAYLILGVLVSKGLKSFGVLGFKNIVIAILICVLYAMSDEFHQLYVSGRGGQLKDVLIDSTGAMVGILGYKLKSKGR